MLISKLMYYLVYWLTPLSKGPRHDASDSLEAVQICLYRQHLPFLGSQVLPVHRPALQEVLVRQLRRLLIHSPHIPRWLIPAGQNSYCFTFSQHSSKLIKTFKKSLEMGNNGLYLSILLISSKLFLGYQVTRDIVGFHLYWKACPLTHIVQGNIQHIMPMPEMVPWNIFSLYCVSMYVNGDSHLTLAPNVLSSTARNTGRRKTY